MDWFGLELYVVLTKGECPASASQVLEAQAWDTSHGLNPRFFLTEKSYESKYLQLALESIHATVHESIFSKVLASLYPVLLENKIGLFSNETGLDKFEEK